ncbi:MAG: response regulator transcription factor, partial [Actinomycetota bacterium]|nr:response regulator transcription factor [Actinomycetota bacterium]
MRKPTRVVLVEDNEVFREALQLLFSVRTDLEVVASATSGSDAVETCREHRPDVVLMDYRLPGLDGVQATAAVRRSCPSTVVVGLTASGTAGEIEALLAAGAVACLSKDQP